MLRVQTSRRTGFLKPSDYDHEINIVDHDGPDDGNESDVAPSPDFVGMSRISTRAQLLPSHTEQPENGGEHEDPDSHREGEASDRRRSNQPSNYDANDQAQNAQDALPREAQDEEDDLPHRALRPSIEVQVPSPEAFHGNHPMVMPKKPRAEQESAIDILYENERGGFLCGAALFSAAALGGLDVTPWTNAYHNPSPTSIHTATVPDPSWDWVWPEWHVNHQDGMDEDGWEYSFAFSKRFSWHSARWWNSFVRRRAWIRKRARKAAEDISEDPHMLNTNYFNIKPASTKSRGSKAGSLASSRVASKTSMTQMSSVAAREEKPLIEDIDMLIQMLRSSRIDREKLEAVENYLENAIDLGQLREEMHEIMSLFVFQASRRILLSRLMEIYDETTEELEKKDTQELRDRQAALNSAAKHADEEVRKLAFWSDIKQMAETGESRGAIDSGKGWPEGWDGVDQSGPIEPNRGKLPEN